MLATGLTLGVVVPTLDEAELLPRLLARLFDPALAPDDRADQVCVADGGSRDGTARIARAAGAALVTCEPGRGAQLAAGARGLATDLLLFLHADSCPEPGSLARVRGAFADPALGAAGLSQRIEAEGRLFRWIERAADARVRRGMVYGDSGLVVRRSLYEAVGGFRPLPLFEDVELSRRLAAHASGRPRLLEGALLRLSARRWRAEGPLRCTLRNWILRLSYEAGVRPARLLGLYPPRSYEDPAP